MDASRLYSTYHTSIVTCQSSSCKTVAKDWVEVTCNKLPHCGISTHFGHTFSCGHCSCVHFKRALLATQCLHLHTNNKQAHWKQFHDTYVNCSVGVTIQIKCTNSSSLVPSNSLVHSTELAVSHADRSHAEVPHATCPHGILHGGGISLIQSQPGARLVYRAVYEHHRFRA